MKNSKKIFLKKNKFLKNFDIILNVNFLFDISKKNLKIAKKNF